MKNIKMEIRCPDCNNLIKVEEKGRKEAIIFLYKKGYGIRQIQRILKYKSPSSVQAIVNLLK